MSIKVHIMRDCRKPEPDFYANGPWWECSDCGAHARAEFLGGAMAEPMRHRDVTEWMPLEQVVHRAHAELVAAAANPYDLPVPGNCSMRPVPTCFICGKKKGQPPERCNGHYEAVPTPEQLTDERIRELQDPMRHGPVTVAMAKEIEALRKGLPVAAVKHDRSQEVGKP